MTAYQSFRSSFLRTWLIWTAGFLAFPLAGVAGTGVVGPGGSPPPAPTRGAGPRPVIRAAQALLSPPRPGPRRPVSPPPPPLGGGPLRRAAARAAAWRGGGRPRPARAPPRPPAAPRRPPRGRRRLRHRAAPGRRRRGGGGADRPLSGGVGHPAAGRRGGR